MRNRTWSNVILAAMIALCVSTVAKPEAAPVLTHADTPSAQQTDVAGAAHSYAITVLWSDEVPIAAAESALSERVVAAEAAADRAMADAATAAGNVASGIEMPFFSFGGGASSE